MDINDAKCVIKALEQKPFVCGDSFIETDNGYVIITKEYYNECKFTKERQTPKKPVYTMKAFSKCPVCKNELYEEQKYCEECGQALDWSEHNV